MTLNRSLAPKAAPMIDAPATAVSCHKLSQNCPNAFCTNPMQIDISMVEMLNNDNHHGSFAVHNAPRTCRFVPVGLQQLNIERHTFSVSNPRGSQSVPIPKHSTSENESTRAAPTFIRPDVSY